MRVRPTTWLALAALAATVLASACSSSSSSGSDGSSTGDGGAGDSSHACPVNSIIDCVCSDGSQGVEQCQANGDYGACSGCTGHVPGADSGPDSATLDSGKDADFDAGYCSFNATDILNDASASDNSDHDSDGFTIAQGDCNDCDPAITPANCP